MTCPVCGGKTTVIDTANDCECVYRRRKCLECEYKFTTTEQESDDTKILNRLRNETKKLSWLRNGAKK